MTLAIVFSALYFIAFFCFLGFKAKMNRVFRIAFTCGAALLFLLAAIFGILGFRKIYTDVEPSLATGAAIMIILVVACLTVPTFLPPNKIAVYIAMPLGLIAFAIFLVAMIYLSKHIIQPRAFFGSNLTLL